MNSFGKSNAGKFLFDILILKNDIKLNKKVNKMYAEYMKALNAIDTAGGITLTEKIKFYLINLIHKDNETKIKNSLDGNIKNLLLNVFDTEYKRRLKSYNIFRLNEIKNTKNIKK